jgi:sec-independent protein translocase protein TatC
MKPSSGGATGGENALTFWDHLDVLRGVIVRMALAILAFSSLAFCLKDVLFAFVMAPAHADFFLYRWMGAEHFHLQLVNVELTEQFTAHLTMSFAAGVLMVSPYILYLLFRFVSPALYARERRASLWVAGAAYVMFLLGVAVNYALVFPLTVRFLGTYQVSADVTNLLTLNSYVNTLLGMSILFGVVFELPVVSALLARFGLLRASWMRLLRRHAFVAVLIAAAVITPTGDAVTLLLVALPLYLLYETSILVVARIRRD